MTRSCIVLAAAAYASVVALGAATAAPPVPLVSVAAPRPVAVRVQWGGGRSRAWAGTIALVSEVGAAAREPDWRTLCTESDAAAMVHADGGTLVVHQPRPVALDGVEIVAPDVHGWRVVAAVGPEGGAPSATIDVPVADLLVQESAEPLDADGNRLTVRPAPGEALRTTLESASGGAVFRPGERLRVTVDPLLPARADGTAAVELRLRLKSRGDRADVLSQSVALEPLPTPGDEQVDATAGRRPLRFAAARFEFTLPPRAGEWVAELEAVEGSSLRWTRPLAGRTVTLVTVATKRPPRAAQDWRVVYELDPGSPRLHERLRRLPGVGLPSVPLPQVPLPSLSRPALPRLPLPSVPMPHVSLPPVPNLSAIVPRLSGLLAAGHSRVELHPLGPMLRLPPAEAEDTPAWEGIVIAGAEPGLPHVVEIEYPSDQDATLGLTVLELDAAGGRVESRHSGGFAVSRDGAAAPARLGTHRFVFWPATRHPVVLLANQSPASPALVGRVRILAGPSTLPAAAAATGRKVHAFLADPGLADFGAAGDWPSRAAAVARSAEALGAQGAAGAMLVVHAAGAATWPSQCTRGAPRWTGDAAAAGGSAVPADPLAVACRVYEREGLRLVPAVAFDAPLAALEAQLARGGGGVSGIACVGRDGRPRRIGPLAGTHYNILDPRVQHAVEALIRELAGRLRGAAAVDGVAIVMPHDGWLHLPGVAWGLDDATFARFRAAAGVAEPAGDDRFAARAALVEGELRDRWLEWRSAEVARFHARLADVIAEYDDRWSLCIAPTTLCAAGPLAERLRPTPGPSPVAAEVLREAGLDPVRSTAHRRVMFVAPHVHGGSGLALRGAVAAGNAVAARGVAAAARRGVVVVEEPRDLDVRGMVPHGPFGSARVDGPCRVHAPATGAEAGRPLAETFAVADAEAVFDSRLGLALPATRPSDRAAVEALVAAPLAPVAGLSPPLVVRASRGDDAMWVHVVNAAGAASRAALTLSGRPSAVMDMTSGAAVEVRGGEVGVDLPAWGMRTLRVEGDATVAGGRMEYGSATAAAVAARVAGLARRRSALEQSPPLDVLDNPGFELGAAPADGRGAAAAVTGWELVDPRRGSLSLVAGRDAGRAASFASTNGLATLRSNPFPPPTTGRASVAAWLRVRDGAAQPPLRMALEGIRDGREYYRSAAVGGASGNRPLAGAWQQFVLLADDLPEEGLESLRVRFDLLGPGAVEIDDVRVSELAFTEPERGRLSRQVGELEAAVAAGDIGSCLVALDGHWPRFLETHVPVPAAAAPGPKAAAATAVPKPAERTGVLGRMWRMWE